MPSTAKLRSRLRKKWAMNNKIAVIVPITMAITMAIILSFAPTWIEDTDKNQICVVRLIDLVLGTTECYDKEITIIFGKKEDNG